MKLLVVEDHALVREGLVLVLQEQEGTRVAEAANLRQALEEVSRDKPDLILLDHHLPDCSGLEAIHALQEATPDSHVVILTGDADPRLARTLIAAGARGFVPKHSTTALMLAAVGIVRSGGVYLPPELSVQPGLPEIAAAALTPRQLQVLRMLSAGFRNREIANELGIAESTIRAHVTSIFRTLGVDNRTQAAREATRLGLV